MDLLTGRRRRLPAVVLAGVVAAGCLVAPAPASAAQRCGSHPRARQALERVLREHGLPGGAVRVEAPGCAPWTAASGLADVRTGRPMRADGRVRIGSVTKTFLAAAMLQLAAAGRVALDAPVERYLPGLIRGDAHDGRRISVRSLLRHTSGLPDHVDAFTDETYLFRHWEPRELVRLALTLPAPGAGWHYSSTGYVIAGMIIERVTGRPFAAETARGLFRPLGLRDTYWPGDERRIRGPHPRGHVRDESGALRDMTDINTTAAGAGGALVSSLADLNRFFGALLDGRLLPAEQTAEMRRTVVADPDRLWPGGRYGLGLIRTPLSCGGAWWGHGGHIQGFTTFAGVGPDGRRAALTFNQVPTTLEGDQAVLALMRTALCEGRSDS